MKMKKNLNVLWILKLRWKQKNNTHLINYYYKTNEFKEKYKYAMFLILTKYCKKFNDNDRKLNIPKEITKRNN